MKVLLLASVLAVTMTQCSQQTAAVSESCQVIRRTLYSNGHFSFSKSELDAMSVENQTKLYAVKLFYRRNCLA